MKINTFFHILVIFLALLVIGMPQIAIAQQTSERQQAIKDARRDAQQHTSPLAWTAIGFVCGGCGVGYAYFRTPPIPAGALLGKTPTYVDTYTRVYRQTAKGLRTRAAIIGCGISAAAGIVASLSENLIGRLGD